MLYFRGVRSGKDHCPSYVLGELMDRNQLAVFVAAILSTLAEFPDGCPESTLYLAVGMDWSAFENVSSILTQNDLIAIQGHWVKPTAKGLALAQEIEAALKAK